ncbi:hypothetical protein Btru_061361 [Bulinus truncatus]|nr:hypothetical protein Btru_061361 [Bulinus truncatus]
MAKRSPVRFKIIYHTSDHRLANSTSPTPFHEHLNHLQPERQHLTARSHEVDDGETGENESFVEDMVVIERPIYSQNDFDQGFDAGQRPKHTAISWLKSKVRKCECSLSCVRKTISHHLPFLTIMRDYNIKKDFLSDIIAGLTVGIMHIPQGMAYGLLSTLKPVYGLYVSFFPVILYFFLGTSKHISLGTFAVISLMVGSAVDKGLKDNNLILRSWNETIDSGGGNITYKIVDNSGEIETAKLMLAMSVTFAVGILQILLGILRLGFLTVYLSDPLISGFTTGAACHVFTSQIKHIFGIHTGRYSGAFKLVYTYKDIFINIPETKPVTLIASIVCMFVLVIVKEYINGHPKIKPRLFMPIPVELIVVVLGTVISYFVKLEEKYDVNTVGNIPVGLPAPNLNAFTYLSDVIADAIAIAIVSFAISVSMAKIFAKKHNYAINSNQELLAYGTCNVVSSFFSAFVSAASLSRSLIQEDVGGKTQVTGLVSSSLLLIVLLVIGPYFETLPNCVLAAIILVALKGMFKQVFDLIALWGISLYDFFTWLITFCATVFLDVDLGLLVGVLFNLLSVIMKSQRPYSCLLGQVPGTDIYRDTSVYKVAEEIPNIKIFRFDSALFFANSEFFKSCLYKLTVDPYNLKKMQKKLDKRMKKKELQLLNITVDSVGSAEIPPNDDNNVSDSGSNAEAKKNEGSLQSPPAAASDCKPTQTDPHFVSQVPTLTDIHYIIIDCSTMSYVDSMGVKVLQQVVSEFRGFNITVYLAQCKSSVREMFARTNFYKTESKNYLFVTIHDAVVSAQLHQWAVSGETADDPVSNEITVVVKDTVVTEGDAARRHRLANSTSPTPFHEHLNHLQPERQHLTARSHEVDDGETGENESFVEDMVVIERPIYSQNDFDQGFDAGQRPKHTAISWLKSKVRKCECSMSCVRKTISHHLPFLTIMRDYNIKKDFLSDIIAGLTVGIMHIPQGMAYGLLSTLKPVYGLYVSFFPVILYFFLGTSKHISLGTFAVISLMVGSAVDKGLKDNNLILRSWNETIDSGGGNITYKIVDNSEEIETAKLMLAMSVTFAVGILQILLGILRLGFLTVYLSDPLISGFTTGAACHVFTSQIKHIFGIHTGRYSGAFKLVYQQTHLFYFYSDEIHFIITKPILMASFGDPDPTGSSLDVKDELWNVSPNIQTLIHSDIELDSRRHSSSSFTNLQEQAGTKASTSQTDLHTQTHQPLHQRKWSTSEPEANAAGYEKPAVSVISQSKAGSSITTEQLSRHGLDSDPYAQYVNNAYENHHDELVLDPGHLRLHSDIDDEDNYADDKVIIDRPIYSQDEFERGFGIGHSPSNTAVTWVKSKLSKCECSWPCFKRTISYHLPFLAIMREYRWKKDFVSDLIAGLTVGIMHIPQGMAYGQLANLEPVYGLYASFFPVIIYFFLGSSKHISMGKYSFLIQTLLGIFRLGFLTVYLSDPLISGFTTGAAVHVLTSQIKHLFGISAGTYSGVLNLAYTYRDIFKNLPQTKPVTLIAAIVCMFVLVIVKEYINGHPKIKPKLFIPVPIELLVVVLGTIISHFAQLEENYSVKSVGNVPVGLPVPNLKAFSYISTVISDSIALAIVSFAITVSMAKIFAKKHNYTVDANQELLAYGISNVICSFFSSYVASASLSRSLIQEDVGGKTQVTGLVSSVLLLIVLLVVGPYFKSLPNIGILLFQFTWIVAFIATVLLDVDIGLLVGVIFALLTVIIKSQRPHCCLLGQVPGTDIYRDISVYNMAEEIPHIKIFRFDSAIFFANAEYFKHCLYKMTVNPHSLKKRQKKLNKKEKKKASNILHYTARSKNNTEIPARTESSIFGAETEIVVNSHNAVNLPANVPSHNNHIETLVPTLTDIYYLIIDCSTVSYIDSMGVKALQQVISELSNFKITVYLAQCKANVREMFSRTNFYKTESKDHIFISTHDAVVHALQERSEAARHSTTNSISAGVSGITVIHDMTVAENLQNFNVDETNEATGIAIAQSYNVERSRMITNFQSFIVH